MSIGGADLLGGVLLGLAGSLHCAGICGGIASTLLLATSPAGEATGRSSALLKTQLGRAVSYVLCGAAVGGGGAAFAGLLSLADAQPVLRVLAACMIVWTGCSVAGLGRGFVAIDRLVVAVAATGRRTGPLRSSAATPVVMGMIWGFAPCGMVYAALLNAMMTGSPLRGAAFMAGFSLGTIPAVAATSFGMTTIAARGIHMPDRMVFRRVLGTSIAALGLISLADPAMTLATLCLTRG